MGDQDNQEYVLAQAKSRYIVVLASDAEARHRGTRQILVVPAYTFHEADSPLFKSRVQQNRVPFTFYLRQDPCHPQVGECYLDFRQVQPLHKGFLKEGKLEIRLATAAVKAILFRFKRYLRI